MISEERGKTQSKNPTLKMNTKEVTNHPNELTPNSEKVTVLFLSKVLGEDIYNLLICKEILQNNGPVMHQLPDVVHVYLNMFGPLLGKWICGGLHSTLIVTKYDHGQRTNNIKL